MSQNCHGRAWPIEDGRERPDVRRSLVEMHPKADGKPDAKTDTKPDTKAEPKPEPKTEPKKDASAASTPAVTAE